MAKYIRQVAGQLVETAAAVDGGGGNANTIPELDSNGRLHVNMMPAGIGADTASIVVSEALAAGDLINIWNDAGTAKVRKADAPSGKAAHGFVLAAFAVAAPATVYFEGVNDQLTGLTGGDVFLGAAGAVTNTVPSTSGHTVQPVGVAISATSINFEAGRTILLV